MVSVAFSSRRFSSGGEGVLDLVRDALRYLAPCGEALSLEELGQVVEDEDHAEVGAVGPFERGGRREERRRVAFATQMHLALERVLAQAVHALDQRRELRMDGWPQDSRSGLAQRLTCGHAQHALGRAVDGGDATRRVEREHARGHRVEHGLRVAAPLLHLLVLGLEVPVRMLEPGLREGEVARHPVERVHEHAQLVVCAHRDLVVEVARGHRPRALGQHLDGLGDAAGQVEAEPRGGEDDDEGHEEEEEDVDALERLPEESQLLVLLEGLADAAQPRLQPLRHVGADHDRPQERAIARLDGHDGLDHVAVVEFVDGGHFLSGEPPAKLLLVHRPRGHRRQRRILGVEHGLAGAVEHRDGGEPQPLLLPGEIGRQHGTLGGRHEPLAGQHVGHVARVAQGHGLLALVVGLRDLERLIEGPFYLRLEPPLDGRVDEVRGDDEDEDGRGQGEGEKGEDELGLEAGAQHFLPALEGELDQVAEEEDDEEQKDDQVQIEEREDGEVRGEGHLGRVDPDLEPPPREAEQGDPAGDDEQIAPVVAPLVDRPVGQGAHCRLVGVRSVDWIQPVSAASPLKRAIQELTPLRETSARTRTK